MRVVDNFGDVGIGWRLAMALKMQEPETHVRLLIDDPRLLDWMIAPEEIGVVDVVSFETINPDVFTFAPIIIESLGCRIPGQFREVAYNSAKLIIHLESLSAESWIQEIHGNESLLGTAARRFILCPGFVTGTLGLLPVLPRCEDRHQWSKRLRIKPGINALWVCSYTYDMPLNEWINGFSGYHKPVVLFITGGTSNMPVSADNVEVIYLPLIDQRSFDTLLILCDLNLVRGEDSFTASLQTGTPTVWQAYPQDDQIHHMKVEAFLDRVNKLSPSIHSTWVEIIRGINGIIMPPSETIIIAFLENLGKLCQGFLTVRQKIQLSGSFLKNLRSEINSLIKEISL